MELQRVGHNLAAKQEYVKQITGGTRLDTQGAPLSTSW